MKILTKNIMSFTIYFSKIFVKNNTNEKKLINRSKI